MQAHTFEASSAPPEHPSNSTDNKLIRQAAPPSAPEANVPKTGSSGREPLTCPTCGKSVFSDSIRSYSGLPDGEPCVWHQHLEGAW